MWASRCICTGQHCPRVLDLFKLPKAPSLVTNQLCHPKGRNVFFCVLVLSSLCSSLPGVEVSCYLTSDLPERARIASFLSYHWLFFVLNTKLLSKQMGPTVHIITERLPHNLGVFLQQALTRAGSKYMQGLPQLYIVRG